MRKRKKKENQNKRPINIREEKRRELKRRTINKFKTRKFFMWLTNVIMPLVWEWWFYAKIISIFLLCTINKVHIITWGIYYIEKYKTSVLLPHFFAYSALGLVFALCIWYDMIQYREKKQLMKRRKSAW